MLGGVSLASATAQEAVRLSPAPEGTAGAGAEELSRTRHTVTIEDGVLEYTAHAGRLPIRLDETGEVRGHVFLTYYERVDATESGPRPLTFLWNGGPGANSLLVHLLGFGPKRIRTPETPLDPPDCDCVLEPNEGTWLGFTDLVFVDPIGTGFSRPANSDYTEEFYGAREDAAYIAEFIRLFVNRFDAWDAPLFIGGESYGTWRAAGAARRLEETGMRVAGVLLISGGVPVGGVEEEEMRVAQLVTSRTAAAFYHHTLEAGLQEDLDSAIQEAERWAVVEYAPALARRDNLTPRERQRVVEGLSRFTGLPQGRIDEDALVVNRAEFLESLLEDRSRQLTTFDTRRISGGPTPPSGARAVLVGSYLRRELGFDTDLSYLGLEEGYRPVNDSGPSGPGALWRYNHAPADEAVPVRLTIGDGPPGARPTWVRDAIALNPSLQVFVATGLFDSLNSCSLNRYVVSLLDRDERDNFTLACYPGGHMMYEDRGVRLEMKSQVESFMRKTAAEWDRGRGAAVPPTPVSHAREPSASPDVVTTSHSIRFEDRELSYTARAGLLPIRHNETGEIRARMFFVSYSTAPETEGVARPLLFAWNGGPGSNAGLLHMAAMGPLRLAMGDVYATADPAQMSSLVDNEATWLGATDLVFVDPVGTGYSRPTRAEYGPEFYDTLGDVESIAEFIRVYLTRFDRWGAPLFLAGESFGSLRAVSVARALQRRGIRVSGLVLISGHLGIGSLPRHLEAPLLLPAYAATAAYHRKLAPSLAGDPESTADSAYEWALGEYANALARIDRVSPTDREAVARELARFTGIPVERIDRETLVVPLKQFSEQLLDPEGRVVGRYDARLSRPRRDSEEPFDPVVDASLAPLENKISGNAPVMIRYLRNALRFESDLYYVGPFGGAWPPSDRFRGDWMSVRWNFSQGPPEPLRDVMTGNPALEVLHASGLYDLVTPSAAVGYIIEGLDPELRNRITPEVYVGGHSFYLDREARWQFMRHGTELIERVVRATAAGQSGQ